MGDNLPAFVSMKSLAYLAEHLRELSVRDVMVRPTVLLDGRTVWTALMVLVSAVGLMPWRLGARDSEGSAVAAVETFLSGLVAARLHTMKLHPRADDVDTEPLSGPSA